MIWLAQLKNWVIFLAVAALAVLGAYFAGQWRAKGTFTAKAKAAGAERRAKNVAIRAKVDAQTQALPDAPAQKVADADPSTAAGELRDDGWTR